MGKDRQTSTDYNDENLGQMLAHTARAWRYALDARLQPLGLSRAQWMALLNVGRADEPLTQTELARLCGVEGPTMAGLLDRMERAGWVERRVGQADRRSKTVHLTDTARRLSRRVERIAAELRAELLEDISPDEIARCMRLLARIRVRASVRDGDLPGWATGPEADNEE